MIDLQFSTDWVYNIFSDNMNAKGVGPLTEILRKIGVSQSPLSKLGKHFEWEKAAAKMQRILNVNFFISVDVMPDPTNRSVNRISISKPSAFHPYGKYVELKLRTMFENLQKISTLLLFVFFFFFPSAITCKVCDPMNQLHKDI